LAVDDDKVSQITRPIMRRSAVATSAAEVPFSDADQPAPYLPISGGAVLC
jgi:hypothetical protein